MAWEGYKFASDLMQRDLKISKEIAILKSHRANLNTSGDDYVSEVEGTMPHLNPFPKDNSCDPLPPPTGF